MLTATAQQPDYIAIALVAAMLLVVGIMALRKHLSLKKAALRKKDASGEVPSTPDAPTAPGAAGQIKLHNVEPKTAAMLMAIVANKMDKPLNELRFISIKEVK